MTLLNALTALNAQTRRAGLMTVIVLLSGGVVFRAEPSALPDTVRASALAAYGKLPLTFQRNDGQTDPDVRFLARGSAYTVFLTPTEAVLRLRKAAMPQTRQAPAAVLRMKLKGANRDPRIEGRDDVPGRVHYLVGNDAAKWQTNVPSYARVRYSEVYPGIDMVYYGTQGQLEYDFIVAPGRDPSRIRLELQGAHRVHVDSDGDLVMGLEGAELRWHRPVSYQETDGVRRSVESRYVIFDNGAEAASAALTGHHTIALGFDVGAYDRTQPLVVDPQIVYSTYLGGSSDDVAQGIAVDRHGHAFVTGFTVSPDFPTTRKAAQQSPPPTLMTEAFVLKMKTDGSGFEYSTYLGGLGEDFGLKIAVADHSQHGHGDEAYVTGLTTSIDFPVTPRAFQTASGGGELDAFVTKLSDDGSRLVYSTYLGGTGNEDAFGGADIAVDDDEQAYVVGSTDSTDFPVRAAHQPANRGLSDVFITKFDRLGRALIYSTYLGGTADDLPLGMALDPIGQVFVTGATSSADFPTTAGAFRTVASIGPESSTAFVTKLNRKATGLVYSTYLGGTVADLGIGVALDEDSNAYVTGWTASPDFPTTPHAFQGVLAGPIDAFVTKFNRNGSALIYSTLLGGTLSDFAAGIAVDREGHAYVTGSTGSPDFPVRDAFQRVSGPGDADAFITKFNRFGTRLEYSSFLGGPRSDSANGSGVALDGAGHAYVVGYTDSPNFPTTRRAAQPTTGGSTDAFLTKVGADHDDRDDRDDHDCRRHHDRDGRHDRHDQDDGR